MDEETPKLEWMYKNNANNVDTEEYLLGKKIDKAFENQNGFNDVDKDILPVSIFANANSNIQVDVIRKVKEDPLEQIKQKELEMRRQLLKNPVKLKKLQNLLKARQEATMRKQKKKKKKHKRENIDDLITEKYSKMLKKYGVKTLEELVEKLDDDGEDSDDKGKRKNKRKSDSDSSDDTTLKKKKKQVSSSDSDSSDDDDPKDKKETVRRKKRSSYERSPDRHKHSNDRYSSRRRELSQDRDRYKKKEKRSTPERYSRHRKTSPNEVKREKSYRGRTPEKNKRAKSKSPEQRKERYDSSDDDRPRLKKSYGLVMPGGKSVPVKKQEQKHAGDHGKKPQAKLPQKPIHKPVKLSEKEKEDKLREMMINAKWREEARKKNVQIYKEVEKRESKKNDKEYDTEFMKKQMSLATSDASVEQRIKANINNIQRSGFAMDKNFARR
ncbi:pre-mRNA-splicing factor CWC25 homolog isoform X2 [Cimex lectularius]|nr:pre-mRNA-splicing factor CWC25 homolog isoform X2 [Cimex lectularius]